MACGCSGRSLSSCDTGGAQSSGCPSLPTGTWAATPTSDVTGSYGPVASAVVRLSQNLERLLGQADFCSCN